MQPKKPFYREVWFQILAPLAGVGLVYLGLQFWLQADFASWLVDGLAFGMMFVIALALASQFVLPVRTMKERREAVSRIFEYAMGFHGPIVFVRDGELVSNPTELKRFGPGVFLVDGSSAIVLERKRKFSRAEGPGIVFTAYKERLAATFDLRRQSRMAETQALTRDGIEIKTTVTVVFSIDPGEQSLPREAPGERDALGQARITPAFPFNPESLFKAHYGFAVNEKQELVRWTDLPLIVTTEYFRDHVSRLTLDDLFLPQDPQATPIIALQSRLTDQVQKAPLLKERGIKVYFVMIGVLELPEEVMRQRERTWAARWQKEALTAQARADVEAERIKEKARAEAQTEMLKHFRDYVSQTFSAGNGEASKREIAQKFVEALHRVVSDPVTGMLVSRDTMRQLSKLRVWVGLTESTAGPAQIIGKAEQASLPGPVESKNNDALDSQLADSESAGRQSPTESIEGKPPIEPVGGKPEGGAA